MNKNYHVTPKGNGWQVKRAGSDRASSLHDTQSDAIDRGRDLARQSQGELRIHRPDGTIRDSDSYGHDPHPPKDRKH